MTKEEFREAVKRILTKAWVEIAWLGIEATKAGLPFEDMTGVVREAVAGLQEGIGRADAKDARNKQ